MQACCSWAWAPKADIDKAAAAAAPSKTLFMESRIRWCELGGNLHGRGIFAPLKKVHVAHFLTDQ
jgi:hypothetical protein